MGDFPYKGFLAMGGGAFPLSSGNRFDEDKKPFGVSLRRRGSDFPVTRACKLLPLEIFEKPARLSTAARIWLKSPFRRDGNPRVGVLLDGVLSSRGVALFIVRLGVPINTGDEAISEQVGLTLKV